MGKSRGIWLGPLKNGPASHGNIKFTNSPFKCLGIYIGTNTNECIEKMWNEQIQKFKNVLHSWGSRKLTLNGKIIIINTLAIPKLVYNLSVLHTPLNILKDIEKEIYYFLWGHNKHPIKKNTVIGPQDKGGLNLVDIFCKEQALKASWIPKLLDRKNKCRSILDYYLNKQGLTFELMLQMTFRQRNQFLPLENIPDFYSAIFLSYNHCKYIKPLHKLSDIETLSQCIWGNEYFKFKEKHLFFKNWIRSGFIYVKDLLDENGNWLNERNIIDKLQSKQNWISEFMIIKKVLGKCLKDKNTSYGKYIQQILLQRILLTTKKNCYPLSKICNSKLFYTTLRDKKLVKPYTEKMWEKSLSLEMSNCDWSNVYTTNVKDLQYKKFSEFKYKILHNILPCGKLVSRWDFSKTPYCTYCLEPEDIQHMLFSCPRIRNIWLQLNPIFQLDIKAKHIILGLYNTNMLNKIRNTGILIVTVMYAIYCAWVKCNCEKINYCDFDIKTCIKENVIFYCNVFNLVLKDVNQRNLIRKYKEQICKL